MSRSGKSQKFVNVRREQVLLDDNGLPCMIKCWVLISLVKPATSYNPLRPETSGNLLAFLALCALSLNRNTGCALNPFTA